MTQTRRSIDGPRRRGPRLWDKGTRVLLVAVGVTAMSATALAEQPDKSGSAPARLARICGRCRAGIGVRG